MCIWWWICWFVGGGDGATFGTGYSMGASHHAKRTIRNVMTLLRVLEHKVGPRCSLYTKVTLYILCYANHTLACVTPLLHLDFRSILLLVFGASSSSMQMWKEVFFSCMNVQYFEFVYFCFKHFRAIRNVSVCRNCSVGFGCWYESGFLVDVCVQHNSLFFFCVWIFSLLFLGGNVSHGAILHSCLNSLSTLWLWHTIAG